MRQTARSDVRLSIWAALTGAGLILEANVAVTLPIEVIPAIMSATAISGQGG